MYVGIYIFVCICMCVYMCKCVSVCDCTSHNTHPEVEEGKIVPNLFRDIRSVLIPKP